MNMCMCMFLCVCMCFSLGMCVYMYACVCVCVCVCECRVESSAQLLPDTRVPLESLFESVATKKHSAWESADVITVGGPLHLGDFSSYL
jgi:hypothetical protein